MSMRSDERQRLARVRGAGFTLVELLIVMGVLVALYALVLVAMKVLDTKSSRAEAELKALALGLRNYADAYGGVFPPSDYSVIETGVTATPQAPSTDEEKSSAVLFYFLDHTFRCTEAANPLVIGVMPPQRGPFLNLRNVRPEMLKDPMITKDSQFDATVEIAQGYSGKTTWFMDPWGRPYRYARRAVDQYGNMDEEMNILKKGNRVIGIRGFILESAGPDGEFGDINNTKDPKRMDNVILQEER